MAGDEATSSLLERVLEPFHEFEDAGTLGGIVLLACTAVALAWANSPWSDSYFRLWEAKLAIGTAAHPLELSLHAWINDALMAVFFLLVGLEIKRECLVGELATVRQATLPFAAALGGMIVPALFYAAVNGGTPAVHGWGVPMATDIAFALGILGLAGRGLPVGLRVFLAALAIADDIGAVLVIAIFYTPALHVGALGAAVALFLALLAMARLRVHRLWPYLVLGVCLWIAMHESGVHATIAGVLLAFAIPSDARANADEFSRCARSLLEEFDRGETGDLLVLTSKAQIDTLHRLDVLSTRATPALLRLEHALHRMVAFAIVPLFALANAGVRLTTFGDALASPVSHGIVLGLVAGKPIGILVFTWIVVRAGLATLPDRVTWRGVAAVGCLAGVGFTMALFVAMLAFGPSETLETATAGILIASTIAGVLGYALLRATSRARSTSAPN